MAADGGRIRELIGFDLELQRTVLERRPWTDGESAGDLSERIGVEEPGADEATFVRLVGFDEVGRGALAGPVTVACASIDLRGSTGAPPERIEELATLLPHLDDSKKLTPKRREATVRALDRCAAWGIGHAWAAEIDRFGIVAACERAARRALDRLPVSADVALFDRGLRLPDSTQHLPSIELTRGDARSLHVAGASVLAKVARDALMCSLDRRFPGYELGRHKGYGTAAHRRAIACSGPSLIHRRSFLGAIAGPETPPRAH